jgi:AcrR family transcriptional regulator
VTRREQILDTAARLFASRGFHGVSVADLGAACGISGPALYKHFAAKEAILAEMLVSISEELLEVGNVRVAEAEGPTEALAALVDWHIDFALDHRALIVVQDRDWESLPDDARETVRALQRSYVELWSRQLRLLDRSRTRDQARAMAHAAFGLINSTPHSGVLPDSRMRPLLRGMALGALGLSATATD